MKILVIGPSWIGDMIMSQSLYRIIIHNNPSAHITVMAPLWCHSVLNRMPEVSKTLIMPFNHGSLSIRERRKIGVSLRTIKYHQAFILPNSFKSALVPFFANIPLRTGWFGEMRYWIINDLRFLNHKKFPLMVQRYAALAFNHQIVRSADDLPIPLPRPILKISDDEKEQALKIFMFNNKSRPIIGFCPGAEFGPAKRWPHYHYATLAKILIHRGYQIISFGSTNDYSINLSISAELPIETIKYYHNLAGKISLDQTIKLIANCQAIISNDSGLMHVASALDCPLVALYGPSSPAFTPPLSHKARVIRLINGYYKIRKGDDKQGYHYSLIKIKPTLVLNELEDLLSIKNN